MLGLDFLKVLRFSFPVPVVGPLLSLAFAAENINNLPSRALALSLAFAAENIKHLPLALRAREKF